MTLYFKGSNGNMREIAQISDSLSTEEARAEALQHIKKFCDDRHFHIYYVRMWNTKVKGKKMTAFDVGSHTESVKEVSVLEGNIHAGYYIDLLKQIGVKVNIIPQKNPEKVFKEVK